MSDVGSARVEVTGDVRNFARQTERDLDRALSKIKPPKVKTDVDVDKSRVASQFLSLGTDAATEMTTGIGKGLGGLSSALGSNPYVAAAGVAIAVTLVAALLPAVGALLSGAVIALGGLSIIGLGALLLKEEPALKAAGSSLMSTLKKTFTDAAKPLLAPLVEALGVFQDLVKRIGPQVSAIFAAIAPAIVPLATGLAGLVENVLPGFQELIEAAAPFLASLGASLPALGTALSTFFSAIADGGPGAALFFQDFITFLSGTIIVLGEVIGWLARVYPATRDFFIGVGTWIAGAIQWLTNFGASVGAALAPLVPVFTTAWNLVKAVVTTAWNVISGVVKVGVAVVQGVIRVASAAISGNWSATWAAIKATVSNVMNAVRSLVSSSISGVRSIISSGIAYVRAVWTAGWNAFVSVVSSAAGRVRSVVSGLASTVRGAFAAAGSWLVSAGRKIIDGLISGIQAGFGRVKSLLGSLTSLLPDWKGPADVDEKILRKSGQLVMAGFGDGLLDGRKAIRDTLAGLTGDLPTFTAGAVRGGDGSSAGATNLGGLTFNIYVTGASGREAGEEAAEAVLERLAQATLVR